MDQQLQSLIDLQAIDTRIGALEADAARLPTEIAAIHAAVEEARKAVVRRRSPVVGVERAPPRSPRAPAIP